MFKLRVIKPFIHQGKLYEIGQYADDLDEGGKILYQNNNRIILVKIENGEIKRPTIQERVDYINKKDEKPKKIKKIKKKVTRPKRSK